MIEIFKTPHKSINPEQIKIEIETLRKELMKLIPEKDIGVLENIFKEIESFKPEDQKKFLEKILQETQECNEKDRINLLTKILEDLEKQKTRREVLRGLVAALLAVIGGLLLRRSSPEFLAETQTPTPEPTPTLGHVETPYPTPTPPTSTPTPTPTSTPTPTQTPSPTPEIEPKTGFITRETIKEKLPKLDEAFRIIENTNEGNIEIIGLEEKTTNTWGENNRWTSYTYICIIKWKRDKKEGIISVGDLMKGGLPVKEIYVTGDGYESGVIHFEPTEMGLPPGTRSVRIIVDNLRREYPEFYDYFVKNYPFKLSKDEVKIPFNEGTPLLFQVTLPSGTEPLFEESPKKTREEKLEK